jgi:hypothetical protein
MEYEGQGLGADGRRGAGSGGGKEQRMASKTIHLVGTGWAKRGEGGRGGGGEGEGEGEGTGVPRTPAVGTVSQWRGIRIGVPWWRGGHARTRYERAANGVDGHGTPRM